MKTTPSLVARRLMALASVVGVSLVIGAPEAQAQGPAQTAGAAVKSAMALDVSLEHRGEQIRVVVLLDRAVDIVEQSGPARVVYRMAGARVAGRRRPVIAPDDDSPIVGVALVPAGQDLDLVIEVRRTAAVTHRLVEVGDGYELRIDVGDVPGRRPAAAVVTKPPTPAPPEPKPRPPAPQQAPIDDPPRTLGGHTFLTPVGGPSPFVTTHIGLSLDFVHARFTSVDLSNGRPYHATLGALSQRLEVGVRILPRLGILVAGGGILASGFDQQSALNLGAAGGGFWLVGIEGVALRVASTGTQVGARLSVEGSAGGQIASIAALFTHAATTMQVPSTSNLFSGESSHTGRFSWSAAQAIGRHASAQAWIGWGAFWTASGAARTEHAVDLTGGVALTADASPFVPLAILVEYDGDTIVSGSRGSVASPTAMLSDRGASSFLAGLYYSGRRDLLLGALAGAATRCAGPVHSMVQGRLALSYFF